VGNIKAIIKKFTGALEAFRVHNASHVPGPGPGIRGLSTTLNLRLSRFDIQP
jgi:hypothetical protein